MSTQSDPLKITAQELLIKTVGQYIRQEHEGVFLEIGSDRMEGSTLFLANLAKQYHKVLLSVDISEEPQTRIQHPNIRWHVGRGSVWCRDIWPTIAQPISLLYLDNFDYDWGVQRQPHHIWNPESYEKIKGADWPQQFTKFADLPLWIKDEVRHMGFPVDLLCSDLSAYYQQHGMVLNNNECQIEHFTQLRLLFPYLTEHSVICFDDTYVHNGCWIGKNGPSVIFLQSYGYHIVQQDNRAVIMMKYFND